MILYCLWVKQIISIISEQVKSQRINIIRFCALRIAHGQFGMNLCKHTLSCLGLFESHKFNYFAGLFFIPNKDRGQQHCSKYEFYIPFIFPFRMVVGRSYLIKGVWGNFKYFGEHWGGSVFINHRGRRGFSINMMFWIKCHGGRRVFSPCSPCLLCVLRGFRFFNYIGRRGALCFLCVFSVFSAVTVFF